MGRLGHFTIGAVMRYQYAASDRRRRVREAALCPAEMRSGPLRPACKDGPVDRDSQDSAPTGPVLTARAWERHVRLAFTDYRRLDDYICEYLVVAYGNGLEARAPVIASLGGDGLAAFMNQLVDDFRGWEGSRHWRSLEGQLGIQASWQSGGHVLLRFCMRPSIYDLWTTSIDITVEVGEELKRLADDFRSFLAD